MENQVLEIIKESFLKQESKDQLVALLKETGPSKEFFDTFNELLIAESKRQFENLTKTLTTFNKQMIELEKAFENKEKQLNEQLEKGLASIDQSDIKARSQALVDYDKQVMSLQKEHKKSADAIIGRLMIEAM